MMDMDAPDHTKRRKLVNRAFTPNRVRAMEPHIRTICDDIIDAVCANRVRATSRPTSPRRCR
jgi:cytochrome P450